MYYFNFNKSCWPQTFKRQCTCSFSISSLWFWAFYLTARLYDEEPEAQMHCPHKHDLLTLLSVGGHWVTTEQHLQVSSFFKMQLPDLFCIPKHLMCSYYINQILTCRINFYSCIHLIKSFLSSLPSWTLLTATFSSWKPHLSRSLTTRCG